MTKRKNKISADYDYVGKYAQDDINGFDEMFLDSFIDFINPLPGQTILDAMGGDGNLSSRLLRNKPMVSGSDISVLEFSRVQLEFAQARLETFGTKFIWGDVLSGQDLSTSQPLTTGVYDKVMIKSANHEIPLARQPEMYKTVYNALKAEGTFINLGFLFDDEVERDEFAQIAHAKDSMAGLQSMVANRHFLTRKEFYSLLMDAGFTDLRSARPFQYAIRSNIVSAHYFSQKERDDMEMKFQIAQVQARVLRRRDRVRFNGEHSIMYLPGEITIATKEEKKQKTRPIATRQKDENAENVVGSIYTQYPYDFLRNLEVHRDLLDKAAALVPDSASVLDLGCALGLLYERIKDKVSMYQGVDISKDFIDACTERFQHETSVHTFQQGNVNEPQGLGNLFDVVTLLNVIYQVGVSPLAAVQNAWDALKSGGTLIVSGPTSPKSFESIQSRIEEQLQRDGLFKAHEETFKKIAAANDALLLADGNYWSVEGMVALLDTLEGAGEVLVHTDIYYGHGYLVAISKK